MAVDLGTALAKKIGKPVQFIEYLASGAITADADKGVWDVTFMPVDAERAKRVSFGAAYHVLTSTYLAMPGASVKAIGDANRPEVRIAIVDGTATSRAAQATSSNATFIMIRGVDEGVALLKDGKADAIALSRESLGGLAAKLPGSRILDGGFLNSYTAAAVPNGKPEALAKVFAICEQWPSGQAPDVEHDPVASEVPTLILAGAYDNLTPITWNKSAFVNLPNAVFVIAPMSGHAVITYSTCAEQIAHDFMADPVAPLDITCLIDLQPQWVLPPTS